MLTSQALLVYAMLHDLLGEQAFQHFLCLLGAWQPYHQSGCPPAAEVTSGRDLRWFFQQWVTERVWLDYAVGRVETAPTRMPRAVQGIATGWKYAASGRR